MSRHVPNAPSVRKDRAYNSDATHLGIAPGSGNGIDPGYSGGTGRGVGGQPGTGALPPVNGVGHPVAPVVHGPGVVKGPPVKKKPPQGGGFSPFATTRAPLGDPGPGFVNPGPLGDPGPGFRHPINSPVKKRYA